jgi:hypothetical protein
VKNTLRVCKLKIFKGINKEDIKMNFVFFTGWTDVRENVLADNVIDLKEDLGKFDFFCSINTDLDCLFSINFG